MWIPSLESYADCGDVTYASEELLRYERAYWTSMLVEYHTWNFDAICSYTDQGL